MSGLRTLMVNRCLLAIVLAVAPSLADAAQSDPKAESMSEILKQAQDSFEEGVRHKEDPILARKNFVSAARRYAMLYTRGARNADLFVNWGNAELLAGRVPRAILAYRRGLTLAPGRRDLVENLALARGRLPHPLAGDAAPPANDTWLSLIPWLPAHARLLLCLAACSAYSLAAFSLLRWLKWRPTLLPGRALLFLLLAGVSGYFWQRAEARLDYDRQHPLVVVARETGFLRGNGASYPSHAGIPTLYPGTEAKRLHQRGDWLQIQLAGGAVGWVPMDAVLIDEN